MGVERELVDNGGQEGGKSVAFEMMLNVARGKRKLLGAENHSGGFEVVT